MLEVFKKEINKSTNEINEKTEEENEESTLRHESRNITNNENPKLRGIWQGKL